MPGFLTPDTIPASTTCRTLNIPDDPDLVAVVIGALLPLLNADNWTQFGTQTPADTASGLIDMYDDFAFRKGSCRMVGEIILYGASASPDAKWLPCDGASLLRVDYPDLFAIIGITYGAADGTHFSLPDLRSSVPLMFGTGTGLSTYALAQAGGEESHTLTVAETPSHTHTDTGHSHVESGAIAALGAALVGVPIPSAIAIPAVTAVGFAALSAAGGGGNHNNIQPYLALNFLIVALP